MWTGIGMAGLIAAAVASAGATLPAGLEATERASVAAVADGATLNLVDGRVVRLAALDIPRPVGERRGPASRRDAVAAQARDALAGLVAGRDVTLAIGARPLDRYGRTLAHVVDVHGGWVQAEMVRRGFARVLVFADERAGLAELLAIESTARSARRGLWALADYRVLSAEEAQRHLDSFQLVEGRVRSVEQRGGRTYLNFGEDWRSDFTVQMPAAIRRQLAGAGLDPADYEGRMVRVRGWIKSRNGPLIELVQPEQIEVIER